MSFQTPVFIPGPTNIPDSVRKACDMPTLDHRSPAFARLFKPAVEGVRRVLKMDQGEIIVIPSTGTGGWEAAISNTLSPGDTVLAARFGMFSHRWIDLCQRHKLDVEIIETPWGEGAPLAAIEKALKADKGLLNGLNVHKGHVTSEAVAESLGLEWVDPLKALAA